MRFLAFLAPLALSLAVATHPLDAQVGRSSLDAAAHVGDRVRITAPSLGLRAATGQLVELRADTLVVTGVGTVPRGAIDEIWVSTGPAPLSEGARRGAAVGALVGTGFTLVLVGAGLVHDLSGDCRDCFMPMSIMAMMGGVVITGGTTAVGALVGMSARPEAWRRAELPRPDGMSPPAPGRALRIGLAIHF